MFDFGEITPSVILREGYRAEGLDKRITPVYISGADYKGKGTEMFAYLGIPDRGRGSYPVILLIHGCDGRAYERWTTEWVDRGFIALAIDNNGRLVLQQNLPERILSVKSHIRRGGRLSKSAQRNLGDVKSYIPF